MRHFVIRCMLLSASIIAVNTHQLAADDQADAAIAHREAVDQLKHIGLALHNYHDINKSFPPPSIDQEGKPLLSWRVAILPYLEDEDGKGLYAEFHLDEPWDGEHNKPLVALMPKLYRCPRSTVADSGRTVYLAPRGEATLFSGPEGISIRKVSDGLSNTIAVVEVDDAHAVPWTKPEDWKLDPAQPAAGLGSHFPPRLLFLFADGSVHSIRDTIDPNILGKLFTPSGGEVVTVPND